MQCRDNNIQQYKLDKLRWQKTHRRYSTLCDCIFMYLNTLYRGQMTKTAHSKGCKTIFTKTKTNNKTSWLFWHRNDRKTEHISTSNSHKDWTTQLNIFIAINYVKPPFALSIWYPLSGKNSISSFWQAPYPNRKACPGYCNVCCRLGYLYSDQLFNCSTGHMSLWLLCSAVKILKSKASK